MVVDGLAPQKGHNMIPTENKISIVVFFSIFSNYNIAYSILSRLEHWCLVHTRNFNLKLFMFMKYYCKYNSIPYIQVKSEVNSKENAMSYIRFSISHGIRFQ